jgi:hypothetical protein
VSPGVCEFPRPSDLMRVIHGDCSRETLRRRKPGPSRSSGGRRLQAAWS